MLISGKRSAKMDVLCLLAFATLGPVVQSTIGANPGLNFKQIFRFVYLFSTISSKLQTNKSSFQPRRYMSNTYTISYASCSNVRFEACS